MAEAPSEQEVNRRRKVEALRAAGIEPYQSRYEKTHTCAEALALFEDVEKREGPDARTEPVSVAGRLVSIRVMGKASFAHIQDGTGRLQLHVKVDAVGEAAYQRFVELDLGDFIGARGPLFRTKRGEITCEVHEFVLLAKALRPLPEKYHGLKDKELRYRQRYLDLVANPEVKDIFVTRSRIISEIRTFLAQRQFVEVETPVLQAIPGGGLARPFKTFHNALDMELYLRIALELHLKRLIVGGFERVYEIGHVFRNEGVDRWHTPEYTMLEVYQAYTDWEGMLELTESLVARLAEVTVGGPSFTYQGEPIDASRPFRRLEMLDAVNQAVGEDLGRADVARLREIARARKIDVDPGLGWGGLVNLLFEELIQPGLLQPTFVLGHPVEVSPLARRRADDPRLTDRFELFIARTEIANAFSEINDPIDQRGRFEDQARARAQGADESHPFDEDFLVALEHGFPPTGGMGLGIDRLTALLTDQHSNRDVILFPHLRSKDAEP
jgi:lysyl-tRNA synthetase class 2